MSEVTAQWSASLCCDCPACGETVDLLDDPEFFVGRDIEIGQHNTPDTRDMPVTCPACGHEFEVDCVY